MSFLRVVSRVPEGFLGLLVIFSFVLVVLETERVFSLVIEDPKSIILHEGHP